MITEKGVIEEVTEKKASVRIQKTGSCENCADHAACHLRLGSEKPVLIEVYNELGAKTGDWVELSMPRYNVLKLSFMVYLFPVLALVVAAAVGAQWGGFLHLAPDVASIVFGGFALLLSFLILKRLDRRIREKSDYYPRMTRIMEPKSIAHSAKINAQNSKSECIGTA